MKKFLAGAFLLALAAAVPGSAQSLDELNVQIHGYATQGFLYTTDNNIFTTHSSDGSPQWTEAVLNVGAQPIPKLRIAAQGRYFLLGNYGGNSVTLDWAAGDYKADDRFGVRFGKVKTPNGLFNDIQDIDPSYMWALLPQSVYPIASRNGVLAHYGGVVYGAFKLGARLGKIEYRGWAGERQISGDDGYFLAQTEAGLAIPNGIGGVIYGGALHWRTPLSGLMVGISNNKDNRWTAKITANNGAISGSQIIGAVNQPNFFAIYEKNNVMVAAEHARIPGHSTIQFTGLPAAISYVDYEQWYAMASYKLTAKLSAGAYDSQFINRQGALGPARYSKDWAISGRYDFGQYLYAKAEEHIIDGNAVGYDTELNPNGLRPNTKLTILKVGVSF